LTRRVASLFADLNDPISIRCTEAEELAIRRVAAIKGVRVIDAAQDVTFTWSIDSGMFSDDVLMTNTSSFPLSGVAFHLWADNGSKSVEAVLAAEAIGVGATHRWSKQIRVGASELRRSDVLLCCDQDWDAAAAKRRMERHGAAVVPEITAATAQARVRVPLTRGAYVRRVFFISYGVAFTILLFLMRTVWRTADGERSSIPAAIGSTLLDSLLFSVFPVLWVLLRFSAADAEARRQRRAARH
jgi:hypothetical protein